MPKQKTKKFVITENMKTGALLEDVNGKFDLVLEQFVDIKKTLNSHTEMHKSHTKNLEMLKIKMDFVTETKADKKDLHKLEGRVLALES